MSLYQAEGTVYYRTDPDDEATERVAVSGDRIELPDDQAEPYVTQRLLSRVPDDEDTGTPEATPENATSVAFTVNPPDADVPDAPDPLTVGGGPAVVVSDDRARQFEENFTKPELLSQAEERGIHVEAGATKAEIARALAKADTEAQPATSEGGAQ